MANDEHVEMLKRGVDAWNAWREENPNIRPNLERTDLHRENLRGMNLSGANFREADLSRADLRKSDLSRANLRLANLWISKLSGANLRGAMLQSAILVDADLADADLTGCHIYGVSAWRLKLERATQENLIITPQNEPEITVDNIEVAQFIDLLLHNEKIRDVINTITSKTVLILGRFAADRKAVLDALREELRKRNLLPILFDFAIPASRDVTETIKTLASLARFVIADVTDATEVRAELHNIVSDFPSLPIQPILLRGHPEFVSQPHLQRFPWFLPTFEYEDPGHLLASLDIVADAEAKVSAVEEALKEARRKIEAELIKPR
jgi:Pentapeptide repeats (8 copies)